MAESTRGGGARAGRKAEIGGTGGIQTEMSDHIEDTRRGIGHDADLGMPLGIDIRIEENDQEAMRGRGRMTGLLEEPENGATHLIQTGEEGTRGLEITTTEDESTNHVDSSRLITMRPKKRKIMGRQTTCTGVFNFDLLE